MNLESLVAWVVIIAWTLISAASVVFAFYGVRVKRPLLKEAMADLATVAKMRGTTIYKVARFQVEITGALYRAQQTLLTHQSLFFIAGLGSLLLRIVAPIPYDGPYEPLDIVRVLRTIGIPIDLVVAQFVIVIAQIFLHRVGAGLRSLYYLNTRKEHSHSKSFDEQ